MYEEEVKEYFTAKRMAATRLLGRRRGKKLRYRPHDLPSNGEIQAALLRIAELAEGDARGEQLAAMRIVALECMRSLKPFAPRLIGSVSTGHVRRGSDIDIQVFVDDIDTLQGHLERHDWVFERQQVTIHKFGEIREYVHFHLAHVFAIELTAYPSRELRFVPRSSTDGKPIARLRADEVQRLIEREHREEWHLYRSHGVIVGLDDLLQSRDLKPGRYDGLLSHD